MISSNGKYVNIAIHIFEEVDMLQSLMHKWPEMQSYDNLHYFCVLHVNGTFLQPSIIRHSSSSILYILYSLI